MKREKIAIDRVYEGLSSGQAPNSLEIERVLYFVASRNAKSDDIWKRIKAKADSDCSFTAIPRHTQLEQVNNEKKEMLFAVDPKLAKELSKSSHKRLVSIIQLGDARVRLNPLDEWSRRTSVTLKEYLGDAACVRTVSNKSDVEDVIKECTFWFEHPEGDAALDRNDPRCLPMSAFAWRRLSLLESSEARQMFTIKYKFIGGSLRWLDDDRKLWDGTGACHGRTPVHVCGRALPLGWHWDVRSEKKGGKRMLVCNGWEAWEVGRNGYINVGPDGTIREGKRCRLLFRQ